MNVITAFFCFFMCFNFENINLRPSVPFKSSVELDGVVCEFEAKVQGGTNENWEFQIQKTGDQYSCTVFREKTSYLFFTAYRLSFGNNLEIGSTTILAANQREIDNKNFRIEGSLVQSESKWSGDIGVIQITSKGYKKDL